MNTDLELNQLLKKYFGFNSFRDNQLHIIKSIINENNNLVIMPTGGGKSLCYQMSALYLDGMAIIISPLIALMKNQVDILKGIFGSDLIACVLNSSLNSTELERVRYGIESGITKLLYIAPESFSKESNINLFKRQKSHLLLLMKLIVFQNGDMILDPNTGIFSLIFRKLIKM